MFQRIEDNIAQNDATQCNRNLCDIITALRNRCFDGEPLFLLHSFHLPLLTDTRESALLVIYVADDLGRSSATPQAPSARVPSLTSCLFLRVV